MTTFAEYENLIQIHDGDNSQVYRAQRIHDRQPVILKVLKAEYPTPDRLRRYRQEYHLTYQLQLPTVVKAYGLAEWQRTLVIIFEDFGGIALKRWMQSFLQGLSINLFLQLAIQIAHALGQLHSQSIIHKDINPANIVLNPETGLLKLIDLGISTQLSRENPILATPSSLEGTLPYLSPEQTGRMNRILDYRTDFYSLGVTFYELLTGRLPFLSDDPMELVHCHIAKPPVPPYLLMQGDRENRDAVSSSSSLPIPELLSQIVMKLMAKNAEDRYQSAWGLKADLEECETQWKKTGTITTFPLGQNDISDQFQIPQKLYGREQETATLLAAFERVTDNRIQEERIPTLQKQTVVPSPQSSRSELILVAGYSGIGKSAVIRSLYKPITDRRGYFISGKFDQFQRNIPYSALVDAFASLVKQLLGEPETVLQQWRVRLLEALGTNGQIVIDVIPDVELMIGSQPLVPELSANEAQNRFNLVFQRFIQACCHPDHPLVIVLDDLQWADLATLNLLERLLGDQQNKHLLMIVAYRDHEVSMGHPLSLTIAQLQRQGCNIEQITLAPLSLEQIGQLIAETLHQSRSTVQDLAELVIRKTEGNPFFTNQFLKTLYTENLLTFNHTSKQWHWDLEQIERMKFTDNVVNLMVAQLQKLPSAVQDVLSTAAYLGSEFDLETLSFVKHQTPAVIFDNLKLAMTQGFVVASSLLDQNLLIQNYQFGHDRIQQAAYSLIPASERARIHYQIGQLLLQHWSTSTRQEQIFMIVNHLNHGMELMIDQTERDDLAQLNLAACRKARAATAYQAVREYAVIGLELIGSAAWQRQYEITLQLHEFAAEATALLGEFNQMNQWIDPVLRHAKVPLDQVSVYIVKIQAFVAQNQFPEAISTGQAILKQLGVEFLDRPMLTDIQQAMQEINVLIGSRSIEALFDLPSMVDPEKLAIIQIAAGLVPACFLVGSPLLPMLIILQVKLSIQYGNSPTSAISYSAYSMLLLNFFQDVTTADPYSRLAYRLGSVADAKHVRAHTFLIVGAQTHHRTSPIRETLPMLQAGYKAALETGQFEYVGHVGHQLCLMSLWSGQLLMELELQMRAYRQQLSDFKQLTTANFCAIYWEATISLLGNPDKIALSFEQADAEEQLVAQALAANDMFRLLMFYIHRAMVLFLARNIRQANIDVLKAGQYLAAGGGAGTICEAGLYFYDSLIAMSMPYSTEAELAEQQQRVQQNQTKLQHWAHHAPMNHRHKWQLVEAERHRVLAQPLAAIDLYEQAILGAEAQEYVQEEALANELTARFYFGWGKDKIAQVYLQEAHYCYCCWGATAKVHQMETEFAQVFSSQRTSSLSTLQTSAGTSANSSSAALDLATVMKASQAISSAIVLDDLLQTLMTILLENAGAQTGCLLLPTAIDPLESFSIAIHSNADAITLFPAQPIHQILPKSVIHYVARTHESIVLDAAALSDNFIHDAYIQSAKPLSLLCYPLLNQGELAGLVYLENKLTTGAFTRDRIELLQLLSGQAAIAITNAQLYAQVKESEQQLQQFLEAVPIGIGVLDRQGHPYYVNQRAKELLGQGLAPEATAEKISQVYQIYMAQTDQLYPNEQLPLVKALRGEASGVDDAEVRHGDRVIPLETWGTPIYNEAGAIEYAIVAFQDITQRKQAEKILTDYNRTLEQQVAERTAELQRVNQELSRLATLDGLTKIANRRRFDDYLAIEWQRHLREQSSLALILMDIDYFKLYNDYYGHQGGDECLIQVAQTIAQVPQRPTDLVARYGGEEFVAILPNTALNGGLTVAEAMRQAIVALAIPHAQSEVNSYVTLSLGIAVLTPTSDTYPDDLIAQADEALYTAKHQGRNRAIANRK